MVDRDVDASTWRRASRRPWRRRRLRLGCPRWSAADSHRELVRSGVPADVAQVAHRRHATIGHARIEATENPCFVRSG